MTRVPKKFAELILIGALWLAISMTMLALVKPAAFTNAMQALIVTQTQWSRLFAEPLRLILFPAGVIPLLLLVGLFLNLSSGTLGFVSIGSLTEKMRENSSWFSSFALNHFQNHSAQMQAIREYENSGVWYRNLPQIIRGHQAARSIEANLLAFLLVQCGNSIPDELHQRKTQYRLGFCVATTIAINTIWLSWPTGSIWYGPLIIVFLAPIGILFFSMRTANRYHTMLFSLVHEHAKNKPNSSTAACSVL